MALMKPLALLLLLGVLCIVRPSAQSPFVAEFIGDRPTTPSCHASTIVETPRGLVAAWFGGTHERHADVGIWVSRQVDGRWTLPVEVANGVQVDGSRHPTWNPVLFQPRRGPLLLFFKTGPSPATWWGMLATSSDAGAAWTAPRRLPPGMLGPIKNKPIELEDGDLLCPSSSEADGWTVHMERTPDLGASWTATPPLNDGRLVHAIQPTLLRHRDGRLQALVRTREGRIYSAESRDAGKSWGALAPLDLPNPNSGLDAVTLADGRFLLVYNHSGRTKGPWDEGRGVLNVAVSSDGRAWNAALVLEHESGQEFSYPAVIQSRDGRVHITYTWKRQRIRHVSLDPSTLESRPIVKGEWPK